jgi:hypothetical protein
MENEARLRQGVAALGRLIAARLAATRRPTEAVHI